MYNYVIVTCNIYVTFFNIMLISNPKFKNKKINENENENKLSLPLSNLTRVGSLRVLDTRMFQGP